jgi:hypothetical protein
MTERAFVGVLLLVCAACSTASFYDRPDCPEESMADWHIPAAWYVRALTPEKAHEHVLTGNLGVDGIRDRWEALHERWRDGDQYWFYRRPEDRWVNPVGWQEGIVLNRGCRQLGFVTTSVQVDEEAAAGLARRGGSR